MTKIKNKEIISSEYRHACENIQIGIDQTDHIVFICEKCSKPLEVIKVSSKNIVISMDCKEKDNCTWIYLVCHDCKTLGHRKFYWKSEDGRFCLNRTRR